MSKPRISKLIKKLIKSTHSKWVFHCIGQDEDYVADDFMNLFAVTISEEVLTIFKPDEKLTGQEIKDRIGKHFGFI